MGKATDEWTFGDVDAVMKTADLVLDETFVTQSTGHQPLETRTAMAYWQNGKLYIHCSTQSTVPDGCGVARGVGIPPAEAQDKIVLISEYTGGGFGSKIPGPTTWRSRRCWRRRPTRRCSSASAVKKSTTSAARGPAFTRA
jgi:CO/xanthine dehydrogenase Mo-binding subunit